MIGWFRRWRQKPDPTIDQLIADNTAKPRAGMERIDWSRMNKAGAARWRQTVEAQGKIRRPQLVEKRRA